MSFAQIVSFFLFVSQKCKADDVAYSMTNILEQKQNFVAEEVIQLGTGSILQCSAQCSSNSNCTLFSIEGNNCKLGQMKECGNAQPSIEATYLVSKNWEQRLEKSNYSIIVNGRTSFYWNDVISSVTVVNSNGKVCPTTIEKPQVAAAVEEMVSYQGRYLYLLGGRPLNASTCSSKTLCFN
jgi:hypothetical protein